MSELPAYAAWRHLGSREGFEVVFFRRDAAGYTAVGQANAVEDGLPWALRYRISFDAAWATRHAHVSALTAGEPSTVVIESDGREWLVNHEPVAELDGCRDVDLEACVFTNALPVHRLRLAIGQRAEAPAAYVRMPSLRVERLEQTYERLPGCGGRRYAYGAPAFGYSAELGYDAYGLILDYPGIGVRCA